MTDTTTPNDLDLMEQVRLIMNNHQYQNRNLAEEIINAATLNMQTKLDEANAHIEWLEHESWPEWAESIRKKLESYGVDIPMGEEVNLPELFNEWVDGYAHEVERSKAKEISKLEAKIAELQKQLESASKDANRYLYLVDMFASSKSDDEIESNNYRKIHIKYECDDTEDDVAVSLDKSIDQAIADEGEKP